MELKLENNLPHQLMPVEGVAAVVEDSIQEAPKASNQNPDYEWMVQFFQGLDFNLEQLPVFGV